jgi:hypothetical protein
MPAFYNQVSYPDHYDTDQVLRFATDFSAEQGFKVCVTFPDGRSVYIEPNGYHFESKQRPTMTTR